MKNRLLLIPSLILGLNSYSQTADSSDQKNIQVKGGLQFISNQTYAGRSDSLKLPVLVPQINFEFKKGFFINTKGYLNLSGGQTTFDGVSIEPGYEFSRKNWNGSLSVIKNFISDSSNLIIAPVNTSLEFYLNKETKVVTLYIGSEYVFSKEGNDLIMYGGLSKNISFSKDDAKTTMDAEPSFSLTAGSQNFYYSFLKSFSSNGQSRAKGKGRGNSGSTSTTTATVNQQSSQFTLLSSAFELPITLTANKLKWVTTPTLEMPINLIKTGSGRTQSSSLFYITTELLFSF